MKLKIKSSITESLELLRFSIPMSLTSASGVLTTVADSMMVGKLGVTNLAAVAICAGIHSISHVFSRGLAAGLPPLLAASIHDADQEKSNLLIHQALRMMFFLFLIVFGLYILTGNNLAQLGQETDVANLANQYLQIMACGLIFVFFNQVLRTTIEAYHEAKFPMYATYAAATINITGNWLLITGNFGFPALGIRGAAIATVVSDVCLTVILAWYLKRRFHFKLNLAMIKHHKDVFNKILTTGVPFGFQWLLEICAFSFTGFILGTYSKYELAAHQIILNVASLVFMIPLGISGACAIKVSSFLHTRGFAKTRELVGIYLSTGLLVAILTSCLIFSLRNYLPTFYTNDPNVILLATELLLIAALFQIADMTQVVASGLLRGFMDVKVPTIILIVSWWVITMPLAYYFAIILRNGAKGMWYALTIGLCLVAVLLTLRLFKIIKVKP